MTSKSTKRNKPGILEHLWIAFRGFWALVYYLEFLIPVWVLERILWVFNTLIFKPILKIDTDKDLKWLTKIR